MTLLLTVLIGLLPAPAIAGFLASALCCRSILQDEEPCWSHAVISALAGICGSLWLSFRGDLLRPSRWPNAFPDHWSAYMIALTTSVPLTVLVVLVAVVLFQQRFKKHVSRRLWIRQHRRNARQRRRRLHLLASSALIIIFTVLLVYAPAGPLFSEAAFVAPNYTADPQRRFEDAPASAPAETGRRPLLDFVPNALVPWPVCAVGIALSGGWLAVTITYWRGYLRVRPRHRRDLLVRRRLPANEH